jgi:signal transduction histidine kinase
VKCDDGKIILWNNAMAQVTHVAETDAIGKDFVEDFLIHSARSGTEAQRFVEIMQMADSELQEINNKVDLRIRKASTREGPPQEVEPQNVDLLVSLNRIDGPIGGKVLVCVGQDVTELKSFQLVEERKEQMLSVVSHELRSPLNGIIGIAAMIEKKVTNPTLKRQTLLITNCATRLVEYVQMMVDLSALRKNSAELKLKKDVVDITKLLDDVCEILRMGIDKHGKPLAKDTVTFSCEYQDSPHPTMVCDALRLTQICTNIIGNALKFTESGFVRVSTAVVDENTIAIVCQDTGTGIEQSALERIFEPFEQEDSSDTRAHGGIGLGLAISRELVRKLGGDVKVESTPGRGSTFTVLLPLKRDSPDSTPATDHDVVSDVKRRTPQFPQPRKEGGSDAGSLMKHDAGSIDRSTWMQQNAGSTYQNSGGRGDSLMTLSRRNLSGSTERPAGSLYMF